jgi:glycosyltransferase involved in cell wall biosynthesis
VFWIALRSMLADAAWYLLCSFHFGVRIAQISPLFESVPPAVYGGTERVVSYLTEELVRAGHDVTLFASGDSQTSARLVPMVEHSLRLDPDSIDHLAHHILMIERIRQVAHSFDILHFHIDYLHFPMSRQLGVPQITTLHGRLDIKDLLPLYDEFTDMPVVSISDSQRAPLPQANWIRTVYHGLPEHLLTPETHPSGDYLVFIGRISPEKRVDRAVEIARRAGLPLRVAAKISHTDETYFREEIAPLFEEPFVQYLGEINDADKGPLLGNARALLFPIDWQEPFGLVMIEAMACGTPTIAWGKGSVGEVLTDNLTGFIVESIDEAADAVERAPTLPRARIRREFDRRFTARRMASDYLSVYQQLLGRGSARAAAETVHHD